MANDREYIDYLLDQLQLIGPVSAKRMFGGHGIFLDGLMFALIVDNTLYFKVDEHNLPRFIERQLAPFTYQRRDREVSLGYYQAPDEAVDDPDSLADWANQAFAAALRKAGRR